MQQSRLLLTHSHVVWHGFFDQHDVLASTVYRSIASSAVVCRQVHGTVIRYISSNDQGVFPADGMMTHKDFLLGITSADCLPVFFFERRKRLVSAVHAGWRGLHQGIIERAIARIQEFGGHCDQILCAIGPHIQTCCYAVSRERVAMFSGRGESLSSFSREHLGTWYLDLGAVVWRKLMCCGVREDSIDSFSTCTCCDTRFSSFRRDGREYIRTIHAIGMCRSL